jgi:hypothetical protein
MYNKEIKREDKIKKVNNRTRDRFCNNVIVLRMRFNVTRNLIERSDWLKGLSRSRVTLSRICKIIILLQNRDLKNFKNEIKMKLYINTSLLIT